MKYWNRNKDIYDIIKIRFDNGRYFSYIYEMDPILRIVHYLFEKQNKNVKGKTINEFFSNGTSFPAFIELILNENIPQIQINPKNQKEKSNNNKLALQFLIEKNNDIKRIKKYFDIEKDKSSLLLMILTKQCFQIDIPDIIRKCNNITYPLNIQFKNETEFQCPKCIISLAKALSDIKIDIPESYINDSDQLPLICFKIPTFPLIIDDSSFKLENINVFLIQILIIFEFYSDKIAKLPQIDFTKNPILKTSLHVKVKDPLLRVINFLGGFDDISNFDQINIIPNFVLTFFNDEKRSKRIFPDETDRKKFMNDLRTITQSSKEEHQKINNIIKLLSKEEPIFNNLLFNFTNTKLRKSSTEMFFVKFLEYFFLTQTKKEMIDRCKKILFTQIKKDDALYHFYQLYKNDEKFDTILIPKIETYLKLLSFANKGNAHLKSYMMAEDLFKKFNIPQIVIYEPTFVIKYYIPYYCQLQFIFELIDERYVHCHIPEMIMDKIIIIRKIEVPKFDVLTANIIARNIALIQQNKIYKEIKEKSLVEKDSTDSINIEKSIKMPNPPLILFERVKNETLKMMQKFESQSGSSIYLKPKDYWNKVDINYNYENNVLYKKNNQNNWDDSLKNQFNANNVNYFVDSIKINKNVMKFYCFKQNGNIELYKLFRYNEIKKEWQKDEKSIKDFKRLIKNDHNAQGTSLVLFLDSYENDSISLCSQLSQNIYPNLDNDQIYVYAMRGKILSLLQYEVNYTKLTEQQEPIFLLLHIPKFKKNIRNIEAIVFQIYYFLSIISDINIVVLNKEHYESQVELIERLYKIHNIYINNSSNKAINLNDNLLMDTISRSCNIFDFSSDGDEMFEEEEEEEEVKFSEMMFDKNDMKIYEHSINIVDSNIMKRQSKFIVLINNNYINGDVNVKNYCPLAEDIIKKLRDNENCSVDFINIDKPITYRMFLTNFHKFVKNSNSYISELFNRFDFVQLTRLSNAFIRYISDINWRSELEKLIQERLDQMEQTNISALSYYELISNLNKELTLTYPSIDREYTLVCNSILTYIGDKRSTEYKDIITKELSKSSIESLSYLEKIIKNKEYWSNKDKKKLIAIHKKFLEDDFFSIIQMKCDKKNSFFVFEKNHYVLLDRIKIDTVKIYDFFNEIENDVNSKKERKVVDISRKKESGTNYIVRERENVREIKAFAEIGGQSDSEFKPDF